MALCVYVVIHWWIPESYRMNPAILVRLGIGPHDQVAMRVDWNPSRESPLIKGVQRVTSDGICQGVSGQFDIRVAAVVNFDPGITFPGSVLKRLGTPGAVHKPLIDA